MPLHQNISLADIPHKKMGAIIEAASFDDLEWFAQMLDLQLEETPHLINEEYEPKASL